MSHSYIPAINSEHFFQSPEMLPAKRCRDGSTESQWRMHWRTPILMILTFVFGVVGGIGHDSLYSYLVDKSSNNQQWYLRAGTAIAFLAKTLFAASIGMSHRQRTWRTLRDKSISIRGIDSLFGITGNPFNFFDLDMIFHAKLATLMAVLVWLLPLSAVVAPATLSVVFKPFGPDTGTSAVPYFDLTAWVPNDNNTFAASLFNIEVIAAATFTGASQRTKKLIASVVYGGDIVIIPSPCSANCSYQVEFHAPTLSCENLGNTPLNKSVENIDLAQPGYYRATLEPVGRYPGDGDLLLKNRLLINTYTSKLNPNGTTIDDPLLADIQNVLCTPYNATYFVKITFTNGRPVFTVQDLQLLTPLDESSETMGGANGSINDGIKAWPARGLIEGIYDVLLGRMSYTGDLSQVVENTTITSTRLAESVLLSGEIYWRFRFVPDLHLAIEEITHNLTLSLFSFTDKTAEVETSTYTTRLVFQYSRATLLTTYCAAAVATLLCLVVGLVALVRNGIASDVSFSRVLVTTRNPELDKITRGACLGGDPLPKDLWKTRLRFGELWGTAGEEMAGGAHAGFGVEGVTPLRKGEKYL